MLVLSFDGELSHEFYMSENFFFPMKNVFLIF